MNKRSALLFVAILLGIGLATLAGSYSNLQKESLVREAEDAKAITVLTEERDSLKEEVETFDQQLEAVKAEFAVERTELQASVLTFSNKWQQAESNVGQPVQVATATAGAGVADGVALGALQEELKVVRTELETKSTTLAAKEEQLVVAKQEIEERDAKIDGMKVQLEDLEVQIGRLEGRMGELNREIAAKEQALQDATGERDFILADLKRLNSEKDQLASKLDDLSYLRDRARELRAQEAAERRRKWMARGNYGTFRGRGAAQLMRLTEESKEEEVEDTSQMELQVDAFLDGTINIRQGSKEQK